MSHFFLNLAGDVFSRSWASAYERAAIYLAAVHLWTKGTSEQGTKCVTSASADCGAGRMSGHRDTSRILTIS